MSTITDGHAFLRAFYHRNTMLMGVALAHLVLIPLHLALMAADHRMLAGESVWLKPLRFDVSIVIYLVTMTLVLGWVSGTTRARYSLRIALTMIIETLCIGLQAARGVKSHFNIATPFDGIVFNIMGLAIIYNTYLLVRVLIVFVQAKEIRLDGIMRHAVVLGIAATLVGSVIGGYMSSRLSHVGVHGGDLRLGHFVALHGLQLMLVGGAWLAQKPIADRTKVTLLRGVFALHLLAVIAVTVGA